MCWKQPPQPPFANAQWRGKISADDLSLLAYMCTSVRVCSGGQKIAAQSEFSPATLWDPRTGLGMPGWREYSPPAESSFGRREEDATSVFVRRAFRTNMVQGLFPSALF